MTEEVIENENPKGETHIEIPGFYPIKTATSVLRSSIDVAACEEMAKWSEQHKQPGVRDNLNVESRTGWELHYKDGFEEVFEPMIKKTMTMLDFHVHTKSSCGNFGEQNVDLRVMCKESWTAWGMDNGATLPHDHGTFISNFTTVLYLALPEGKETTWLEFLSQTDDRLRIADLRAGDLLLFPSNLAHYTFDVVQGRILNSSNWVFNVNSQTHVGRK